MAAGRRECWEAGSRQARYCKAHASCWTGFECACSAGAGAAAPAVPRIVPSLGALGSTSPMIFSTWSGQAEGSGSGSGSGCDAIRVRVRVRVRLCLDLLGALPGRRGAGVGAIGDARAAEQLVDPFPLGGHRRVVRSIGLVSAGVRGVGSRWPTFSVMGVGAPRVDSR